METYLIDQGGLQLTQNDLLIRAGVAAGIGALIGLEREYAALREPQHGFAGIRTFVFVTLLGFLATLGFHLLSPAVYVAALAAVIVITAISYFITASRGDIGATTEFSVLIGFFLGSFACLGLIGISLMITVLTVVLLSAKFRLKTMVGQISAEELYDFLRFVVIALLLFPFLPDAAYGPGDVIHPREIGWVILLTSGLGFLGYMLTKFLGPGRGILLGGLVGGLISSTAVTWVYARKSKGDQGIAAHCAVAILAASGVMLLRALFWTWLFNRALFGMLLPAFGGLILCAFGYTLFLYFRHTRQRPIEVEIRPGKPLDLHGALVFGGIYLAVVLLVYWTQESLGDLGLLLSSALAGITDIDAITLSLSKMAGLQVVPGAAARGILIATLTNTAVKAGIGLWAGDRALRPYLLAGYGLVFAAGIVALLVFG